MSQKRPNRHERRLEQFKPPPQPPSQPQPQPAPAVPEQVHAPSSVRQWVRAGGVISICFGAFGLLKDFFWSSVIAIYAGFAMLVWDIWLERFSKFDFLRFVILGIIGVLLIVFSVGIVFHTDPIEFHPVIYQTEDTGLPEVQVIDDQGLNMPRVLSSRSKGEKAFHLAQTRGGKWYEDFRRIRCVTIPRNSAVQFEIRIREGDPLPSKLNIEATYQGKYRQISFDSDFDLTQMPYPLDTGHN